MATPKNVAGWDRVIRVLVGIAILFVGWTGMVTGGWGLAFKIVGFVPLVTGIVGWCPLYALLGISTRPTVPGGGPPAPRPVA